jgi:hypothetical protein
MLKTSLLRFFFLQTTLFAAAAARAFARLRAAERIEIIRHLTQRFRVQGVMAPLAFFSYNDDPGGREIFHMMR